MLDERHLRLLEIDRTEPDEWDLDVRFGELAVACGCADHDLTDFLPTGGGGTCKTDNATCPNTCAGPTCAATCPNTCKATCQATCRNCPTDNCPTESLTCNNTHCFTCRSGCHIP